MAKLDEPFHTYWNGGKLDTIRPIRKQSTHNSTIDNEHYRKLKEAIRKEAMKRWS